MLKASTRECRRPPLASDGTYTYTYDDEGNRLTRRRNSDGAATRYAWDHRNRLIRVSEHPDDNIATAATSAVEYTYDAFDHRIRKMVDSNGDAAGGQEFFYNVYQGDDAYLEIRDPDGLQSTAQSPARAHRYLHGPAVDQALASQDAAGNILWGLGDQAGTIRDVIRYDATTQQAEVVNHRKYDAFGKTFTQSAPAIDFVFGYAGRPLDPNTGLYDNRARWYDPGVGRFASEDPSGLTSDMNLYRYAGNSPVDYTDPTGLGRESLFTSSWSEPSLPDSIGMLPVGKATYLGPSTPLNQTAPSGFRSQSVYSNYGLTPGVTFPSTSYTVNPIAGLGLLNAASSATTLGPLLSSNLTAPESITIASWLPGVSSDAYLHLTPLTSADLASGIRADSSWAKMADVSSLTVPQYKSDVVMRLAAAYGPDATNFAVMQPADVGYPSIQPDLVVGSGNIARVQEYINVASVKPGMTVAVPRMAATGAENLAAEAKGLSSLGAAAKGGMSNAQAVAVAARGIEAVANVGVAFWAEDMDRQFVKQSAAGLNNLLSQIAVNDHPSAHDVKEIQQRIHGLRNYSRGFWGWAATVLTLGDASYKEQQSMAIDRYTSELAEKYGYEASHSFGMNGDILTRTDRYTKK